MKASAFATVMFVMQACYGAPHDPYMVEDNYEEVDDTTQEPEQDTLREIEAE